MEEVSANSMGKLEIDFEMTLRGEKIMRVTLRAGFVILMDDFEWRRIWGLELAKDSDRLSNFIGVEVNTGSGGNDNVF